MGFPMSLKRIREGFDDWAMRVKPEYSRNLIHAWYSNQ